MNPSAQVQTQVSSLIRRGFPLQNILTCLSDVPADAITEAYDSILMEQFDAAMLFDAAA